MTLHRGVRRALIARSGSALALLLVLTCLGGVRYQTGVADSWTTHAAVPAVHTAPARAEASQASAQTVLILVPGIVFDQSTRLVDDPYQRASNTFSTLLDILQCDKPRRQPSSDSPFVSCADPSLSWVPYSYRGVEETSGSGGTIVPYTHADTGQSIAQSATALDQLYNLVTADGPGATVFVISHSLGGAIASYWGAQHQNVKIVTFDAPVNGIWPTPESDYGTVALPRFYCSSTLSTGMWDIVQLDIAHPFPICAIMTQSRIFETAVIRDLYTITPTNAQANAINFANSQDVFVPSWYALLPSSPGGQVLVSDSCASSLIDRATNHLCVLEDSSVQSEVADIIYDTPANIWGQRHDAPPADGCAAPACMQLHITAQDTSGASVDIRASGPALQPGQVRVELAQAGADGSVQGLSAVPRSDGNGGVFVSVPWTDVMVKGASVPNVDGCAAVLPAAPTPIAYEVTVTVGVGQSACNDMQIP